MKLKKIASLMLAGVMAISMLAGCSNGNGGKDEGTVVVPSDLTGKVIAALDEDTTDLISFSSSTTLNNAVATAVKMVGTNNPSNITVTLLNSIDSNIADKALDAPASGTSEADSKANKKEAKGAYVYDPTTVVVGAAESYNVKKIAEELDDQVASLSLPTHSADYTVDDETFYLNYKYTAELSVVELSNPVNGTTDYVVVATLVRTASVVNR